MSAFLDEHALHKAHIASLTQCAIMYCARHIYSVVVLPPHVGYVYLTAGLNYRTNVMENKEEFVRSSSNSHAALYFDRTWGVHSHISCAVLLITMSYIICIAQYMIKNVTFPFV